MTRDEAEKRAQKLQAEDPERSRYRFVAREAVGGEWEVTRVELPDHLRRGPLTESVEAKPKPSPADDPRTGHEQRIPGVQGGL